jgi:RNA polymerase sigma-70 factor (ECF subfamily)
MEELAPGRTELEFDEAALLLRLRAGDAVAFEALVRRFCAPLLQLARRVLRQEEDAQEAVQEAFLSAFRGLSGFDGRARLGTWLHRVALNAALQKLRRRRRHPERSIEDLLPHFGDDEHQVPEPVPWHRDEDVLQRRELRELVHRCIDRLPEIYRTVLLLRDIEGLDTDEAARLLETSATVVKTRLHRARQALRTLLDPHLRGGDA